MLGTKTTWTIYKSSGKNFAHTEHFTNYTTAIAASKNNARFKSGQNQLQNNHLA